MKRMNLTILTVSFSLLVCFSTSALSQTYQGRATAVKATVTVVGQPVVTTAISDTGNLPDAGGGTSLTGISAGIANVGNISSSNASTSGVGNSSTSIAGVNTLSLNVLNAAVGASIVQSTAQATCPGGTPSGGSTIADLTLNGTPITVTGAANQTVQVQLGQVTIGTLVINEQVQTPYSMTVNALHLIVTDPVSLTKTDVVVSSARAGMTCVSPPQYSLFDGHGTAVWLEEKNLVQAISTFIGDTGDLPGAGGNLFSSTANAGVGTLLTTGAVSAHSSGGVEGGNPNTTQSDAGVDTVSINALNVVRISANTLASNTQCSCSLTVPTCSGTSGIANIAVTVSGIPVRVNITGQPNQTINLPAGLGMIVLNERSSNGVGPRGYASATAMRVVLNVLGLTGTEIKVADASSGIYCGIAPSAAHVSVGGRVLDPYGNPLRNTVVGLVDSHGLTRHAVTSPFGYYIFDDVEVGEMYSVVVKSRQFHFQPRLVNVLDQILDLDFFGQLLSNGVVAEQPDGDRKPAR